VCLLVFRVMLTVRVHRAIAAIAALWFMVYPAHFEASAWFAALPTQFSCAIVLWMLIRHVRWSREGGRWHLVMLPIAAFVACCLNEQPAAGVALVPFVYLATGKRQESRRVWLVRAIGPMALACIGVGVYLALLTLSAPAGHRGSGGTLAGLSTIGSRLDPFLTVLWRRMILKNFATGAESYAITSMGWTRAEGAWYVWLPLTLLGAQWTIRTIALSARGKKRETEPRTPMWRVALLGLAGFIVAWIPALLAAGYEPDSRLRYWADVWLVVALAGLVSMILRAGARMLPRRTSLVLFFVIAIAAGAASGVLVRFAAMNAGVRLAMADRFALDRMQGEELRALLPNPTPGTLFVPLSIETTGIATRSPVFDTYFRGAMEFPWTVRKWLIGVYGRSDVKTGFWRGWTIAIADGPNRRAGDPVRGAREEGLVFALEAAPRIAREGSPTRVVPWDLAAPFVVGKDARVRLVTAIVIVDGDGKEKRIEVPQARGQDECVARLPRQ
jgi:hypothetical protein